MLLIGVDVGGTSTDGVLIDTREFKSKDRGVIKFKKVVTTPDVSNGIENVINKLFTNLTHSRDEVKAITIGTTHFINAVIEQDKARLEKVAVIRICGPYSQGTEPFSNFPEGLTSTLKGYIAYVNGGHHVDGNEIQPLDEDAIIKHAIQVKNLGINSIVINGIFSTIDKTHELRAAELFKSILPHSNVVVSHEVSGIGYLARENASILNASIMNFAAKILKSFANSIKTLKFKCPLLLTQNDGTVLTISEALKTPIRTFASGATNSMRGASFLCSKDDEIKGKNLMVVDIGGTTADVGLLLSNGFPRQSSSHSIVGGVRMNFSMPHVESIGLGGGSIVRKIGGKVTIGPDSVGSEIGSNAIIFGGNIDTTTDVTAFAGQSIDINSASIVNVKDRYSKEFLSSYDKELKLKLNEVIDRMRTNPEPLPILLVGGGSIIAPLELEGASKVIRPPYFQVANAIGAALGKLGYKLHKIKTIYDSKSKDDIIKEMKSEAIEVLTVKGALKLSIEIIDITYNPIPYVDKTYSFEIKVVGDIDYDKVGDSFNKLVLGGNNFNNTNDSESIYKSLELDVKILPLKIDHKTYIPKINEEREWIISETDIEYINIGAYILGCGGGGTPYPSYLELRNLIRNGDIIKVKQIKDLPPDGKYIPIASAGSPTVSDEQLLGNELIDACEAVFDYMKYKPNGIFSVEIGGGNGLRAMLCGASSKLNLPAIDCDLMGRAYPNLFQIVPCIFTKELFLTLSSVSDGNGNQLLVTNAQSDIYVEKVIRAALSEVGAHVGLAHNYMSTRDLETMSVHQSISSCWRIGRAVKMAHVNLEIDKIPDRILESLGGEKVGKKIFQGKIVGVEKKLFKGHVYGEVIIENKQHDQLSIPFKNENLAANLKKDGSNEWKTICSVPDLISVSYAETGEAVGTPEYRYGIMVFVLAISPSDSWVTERGLEIGGPKSFGPKFENILYTPVGEYIKPKSVIDEYYRKM